MSLRRRALSQLRRTFADEKLPLRLTFWDGDTLDFSSEPTVTIRLGSPALLRCFLTGQMTRLGDAYIRGDLVVDGPIEDILRMGLALAERIGKISRFVKILSAIARLGRRGKKSDAANIRHHYDVSNEFYALWLDRTMTYSCAYFRQGDEDIDTAQTQKLDHICRKLRLQPGQRVLDIGCGWGGLLRHANASYGVTGLGVTNSEAQYDYIRARQSDGAAGLEFRLQDYRDLAGEAPFDRIVSVGMYEHVGLSRLSPYFSLIARLLRPGGVLLNHGIVVADPRGPHALPGGEFIDRHVFPGGELPHLSQVLRELALNGLEVVDVEDLRPHYARTLMLWSQRLEARREEAAAHAGAERYRIWRVYLPGMAMAFDAGWLSVAQVLAYKPCSGRPAARPWTRAYQYGDGPPHLAAGLSLGLRRYRGKKSATLTAVAR